MKMKKVIGIIVGLIILFGASMVGGKLFADKTIQNNNTSKQVTSNVSTVQQQKVENDNTIDGFDLGVLTKEDFHRAMSLASKYKGKNLMIKGINEVVNSDEIFQQTYGNAFCIQTPYVVAIDYSKQVAEQYLEVNDKNVIDKIKNDSGNFNKFICTTIVGGTDMDFLKSLHMVLRVYGKNETKELQPVRTFENNEAKLADTSKFFPDNPSFTGGYVGYFEAKDVMNLDPQKLEIIVIYSDGKEVKQSFDYNQLNQL